MTDKPKEAVFHILHDLPTNNDAFGPHQKIAETLATMITGPAETPDKDTDHAGYFVALEGGWGSGKSTVVKMLRDCLGKNKAIESQTIIFDAWAHSGDHLRRAFLEVLVHGLIAKNFLNDSEAWKEKLEKLSGRLGVTTQKRTPTFTTKAKCFGLSLLLMTIGGVFSTTALGKQEHIWDVSEYSWQIWISLGATFSPLIFLFVTWGWVRLFGSAEQIKNMNSTLLNHGEDKVTIETQSAPDPTSIEFQRIFQDAITEALSDPKRRLVLVVDNLDRIPPNDAMQVWRTLQTFIDKNEHDEQDWQGKLWTLVPYDRDNLKTTDSENNSLGHFEKIFDTSLHVPAPAPTLWQSFFKGLLSEAFPNEAPEDRAKVIDLMEAVGGLDYTPRNLKRIINNAGPIYIQWRSEFTLADVVYYVLRLRLPSLNPEQLNPTIVAVLGEKYLIKMDAIQFNAPIEIAREIQLISSIEIALKQGKSDNLQSLSKLSNNFKQLLAWTCQRHLPYWSGVAISSSACNLMTSGIWASLEPDQASKIRNVFISCFEQDRIDFLKTLPQSIVDLGKLSFINDICNKASISQVMIEELISLSEQINSFSNLKPSEFSKFIIYFTQEVHKTQPSIFDDEMINKICALDPIQKYNRPPDIDAFKVALSTHK